MALPGGIRQSILWPYITVNTITLGIMSIVVSFWSAPGARRFARVWAKVNLWGVGVRLEVEGLENLPENGPQAGGLVVAANHSSALDIWTLLGGLPLDVCWVAKSELLKLPALGWHLKRVHIPVARKNAGNTERLLQNGVSRIQGGASVTIFPEGTRNKGDGNLLPFKKGAFILGHASGRPIVPVAIVGSSDLWPTNQSLPSPGTVKIRIGPPLDPGRYSAEELEALARDTREAISGLIAA